MDSFKNNEYIDLMEIARSMWAYKFLLIALTVVMAVLSVVRVQFFKDDRYVATGMLYVSNRQEIDADTEVSGGDIDAAISMSATYREILKTRSFLTQVSNEVAADYGKDFSWNQIMSMTSISAVNETELMQISVVANNPDDAYHIAETIVNKAPETLGRVFERGLIKIVDEVSPPSGPVGKGTAGAAAKGGILGLFIGVAIIVVMNFFDTKIHKSEDVARRYNVSILGEIAQ